MSFGRVGWLALVLAVLAVTFGHLLGPFDFLTFLHAGQQVLHGASPYPSVNSAVFRSGHGFVYPLFVAWLFAPLALLPQTAAEAMYGLASVAAIVVACRMLGRRDLSVAALVLVCSTTIIGLQMGTVNAFLLLGLAAAWHWRSDRPLVAGLALGLATGAKLFLLPVLLWPLLTRRYATTGSAAATVAALLIGGGVAGGQSFSGYLHLLSQLQADEQVGSWSLSSLFQSVGFGRSGSSALAMAVAAGCLVVLWRRRHHLTEGRILGAMVVCSLLMSPIVWSSYLLLLAVPLLLSEAGDTVLAGAALASWAVVTPDAASSLRVAVGLVLAAVAAYMVTRHLRGQVWHQVRRRSAYLVPRVAIGAAVLALCLVLPASVRSPLPALAAMALINLRCLRHPVLTDPVLTTPAS